jgi:hypothetical protein
MKMLARYKIEAEADADGKISDDTILECFQKMKDDHAEKSRPELKEVLKDCSLNHTTADPVGRCIDFRAQVNDKLTHSCLDYLWDEADSANTLLKEINRKLPDNLRKSANQRNPKILKDQDEFYQALEQHSIEINDDIVRNAGSRGGGGGKSSSSRHGRK